MANACYRTGHTHLDLLARNHLRGLVRLTNVEVEPAGHIVGFELQGLDRIRRDAHNGCDGKVNRRQRDAITKGCAAMAAGTYWVKILTFGRI